MPQHGRPKTKTRQSCSVPLAPRDPHAGASRQKCLQRPSRMMSKRCVFAETADALATCTRTPIASCHHDISDSPGPMDTPSLAAAAPSGSPCWENTRCLHGDGLVGSCWEIPAGCRVGGVVNRTGPASCELGIRHLTRRTPRKLRGSGPKTDGAPIDRLRGWGVWQHPATTPEHGGRDVHSEEVMIAVMQRGYCFTRVAAAVLRLSQLSHPGKRGVGLGL